MNAVRARAAAAVAGVVAIGLLGACGDRPSEAAAPTSIQDALGMDENAMQEREAKVQEEVRKCMAAEGFDYVPMDSSRMNIRMVGPGTEDDAEFRRTKGYGITTMFGEGAATAALGDDAGNDDPNRKIREALSDEDKEAYDKALFGRTATVDGEGGTFSVQVGAGGVVTSDGEGEFGPSEAGCFGQAQEAVGNDDERLERVGPKLQELQERIASDPRMVKANADWAECMAGAGYDFESPDKIPQYLFGKMSDVQEALGGGGDDDDSRGPVVVGGPGGAIDIEALANSPELAALQREELAIAKADDGCAESTGRKDTAKKVRTEAEKRFLEENPNLGQDGA